MVDVAYQCLLKALVRRVCEVHSEGIAKMQIYFTLPEHQSTKRVLYLVFIRLFLYQNSPVLSIM